MSKDISRGMPEYICHKKNVYALQIAKIEYDIDKAEKEGRETDGSAVITPVEQGYMLFKVDHDYLRKHKPEVGGCFVVHDDGSESFISEKSFKDEYTALKGQNGVDKLKASEALHGFACWLLAQEKPVIFSSKSSCAIIIELISKFCKTNNLSEPSDHWSTDVVYPEGDII